MEIEDYEELFREHEEYLELIREILSNADDPISDVEKMSVNYLAQLLFVINEDLNKYCLLHNREETVFNKSDINIDLYQTIILSIYDKDLESLKQMRDDLEESN